MGAITFGPGVKSDRQMGLEAAADVCPEVSGYWLLEAVSEVSGR